jgi:hypothetical protein
MGSRPIRFTLATPGGEVFFPSALVAGVASAQPFERPPLALGRATGAGLARPGRLRLGLRIRAQP